MKIPFLNFEIRRNNAQPKSVQSYRGESLLSSTMSHEGVRVAPKDLWQVYRLNADVYSCIRELKQSTGAGGYQIMDKRDIEVEAPQAERSFIEQFFKNSGGLGKIKNNIVRDCSISGNAYFEVVKNALGQPYSLKRLDPRTMYIIADKHGTVIRYVQRVWGNEAIDFTIDEVVHFVLDDDPDNELLGMSPLETALWEARTDIASAESNYYFFENDAVPSNVYILEGSLSAQAQKDAFEQIKAQFSGAKNRHKAGVLAGVREIKTISMSQHDMEFVVGRRFNTEKVCSVYGVPKYMLGYTDGVNYANGLNMRADFYSGTIVPLENFIASVFNEKVFKLIKAENSVLVYGPQNYGEELEANRFYLDELRAGVLTLRQYKTKTGQDVSEEDEQEMMIDKHILHNGASALLLEDVGVEPIIDPNNEEKAEKMINALKTKLDYED